jgi:hypothetical protein
MFLYKVPRTEVPRSKEAPSSKLKEIKAGNQNKVQKLENESGKKTK